MPFTHPTQHNTATPPLPTKAQGTITAALPHNAVNAQTLNTTANAAGTTAHYPTIHAYLHWTPARLPQRTSTTTSIDTGSLIRAIQANPVDIQFTAQYTRKTLIENEELISHHELTQPPNGTIDAVAFVRPQQTKEYLTRVTGSTMLTLMNRTYPGRFVWQNPNGGTPQEVLTTLFRAWYNARTSTGVRLYPWFNYAPVPDLRTLTPELLAPHEYGPNDGAIAIRGLLLEQKLGERLTMREIIDNILSAFPGVTYHQNASGQLEIRTPYGPDAHPSYAVAIKPSHVTDISIGREDPFSIENRWTVSGTSFAEVEGAGIMPPAWFQFGNHNALGSPVWYTPPGDRLNLQPGANTPIQAHLKTTENSKQRPIIWKPSEERLAADPNGIKLTDPSGNLLISAPEYRQVRLVQGGASTIFDTGVPRWANKPTGDVIIPYSGETIFLGRLHYASTPPYIEISARWVEKENGVQIWLSAQEQFDSPLSGSFGIIVAFQINDATRAVMELGDYSVTYGMDNDHLPSPSGGNAIFESQQRYGVREQTIHLTGFDLGEAPTETLRNIAIGGVTRGLTPRVIRDATLTVTGSTAVRNEHVGLPVQLPTGEIGALVGRQYRDDFTNPSFSASIQVEVLNPTGAGAIEPGFEFIKFFNNDVMRFFDATRVEWLESEE